MPVRPLTDRMAEALAAMSAKATRRPKAFYLNAPDWIAFTETKVWPTVRSPWGNNPTVYLDEPAFGGVPVRDSRDSKLSRLYDHTGTGRKLPE